MKKIIRVSLMMLAVNIHAADAPKTNSPAADTNSPRERLLLDFNWKFHPGNEWGAANSLAKAGQGSGLWPVAFEQSSTLVVTLAIALKSRQPLRIPVREVGLTAFAGASGLAATVAYFYATHFSMLAVAAVLVSLYPGVTVLLARVLLHERFGPAQRAGLGLCALAVVAIALN